MQVIAYNGRNLVLGMDWLRLPPDEKSRKKELPVTLRQLRSKFYLTVDDGNEPMLAACSDVGLGRKPLISGAAWLAAKVSAPAFIFVHFLDEKNVWVCAANNGCPIAQGDKVLPVKDVENEILNLSKKLGYKELYIFGNGLRTFPQFRPEDAETAKKLTAIGLDEIFTGSPSPYELKRVPALSKGTVMGLFACLGLISFGAAWWYFDYQTELMRKSEAEAAHKKAIAEQIANLPSPEQVYAANFTAILAKNPRIPATQFAEIVSAQLHVIQDHHRGWDFDSFSCVSFEKSCKIVFRRNRLGDNLHSPVPEGFTQEENNLNRVAYAVPFSAEFPRFPVLSGKQLVVPILEFFAKEKIKASAIPAMQTGIDLGATSQLTPLTEVNGLPSMVTMMIPEQPPKQIQSVFHIKEGRWQTSGSLELYDILKRMPESMLAEKIDVQMTQGKLTFNASGVFYEAEAPAGYQEPQAKSTNAIAHEKNPSSLTVNNPNTGQASSMTNTQVSKPAGVNLSLPSGKN